MSVTGFALLPLRLIFNSFAFLFLPLSPRVLLALTPSDAVNIRRDCAAFRKAARHAALRINTEPGSTILDYGSLKRKDAIGRWS